MRGSQALDQEQIESDIARMTNQYQQAVGGQSIDAAAKIHIPQAGKLPKL